jgi:2-phospho-L-lactate transferase/gluconeogenesis factor (CofD/UPF0052 family)
MKIVIFSGGTGSVQLQTGLNEVFNKESLEYTVITNLGDNGLSTGTCRKVMDGKIMGPSDLRKNQMLRAKLLGSCPSDLYQYLDSRFTIKTQLAKQHLMNQLVNLNVDSSIKGNLAAGIKAFFDQPMALQIDYDDFSVSNIIYSGLAKLNGYSLDAAGKIFETILGIPEDSVISNSDYPMYLVATTESGFDIMDEGDIVSWNNPNDKIVSCRFVDNLGHTINPIMSEKSVQKIKEADMIIFSTGTQWSSLIPTYISAGFNSAISQSKATMYLLMNAKQDKDTIGVTGDDLLNILADYLPLEDINIVAALDGDPTLVPVETHHRVIKDNIISKFGNGQHDPRKLIEVIFKDYYAYQLENKTQVFDYDDTIVARGEQFPEVSKSNMRLLSSIVNKKKHEVWISTGNSVKAIKPGLKNINVLADGGVNRYWINDQQDIVFMKCLDEKLQFTNDELDDIIVDITSCGIDISKIQIRGKVMVSIKPIAPEYREPVSQLLKLAMPEYTVKATGRTTIDIYKPEMNKKIAVDLIFKERFTYVGDEGYEGGNDYEISMTPRACFNSVRDVRDTNMYLTMLDWRDDWN